MSGEPRAQEYFSSRWGLLLAALGMAVGTGNIWRFPRIAAQNGGGSFLIAWLIFLFLWSVPLLLVEFAMGKATRRGTVGAFSRLLGPRNSWMGAFVGFVTMAIMFYYSVVAGWCLRYLLGGLGGQLSGLDSPEASTGFWDRFTAGPSLLTSPLTFHFLAMLFGSLVVYRGISRGIERANKVLIPALFGILIVGAVRALTLSGDGLEGSPMAGLAYLFTPELDRLLDYRMWLEALSQSAWSTGAGWGLILTYGVYMRKREDVVLNTFVAGFGNNSASLLAALMIFPTVFAVLPAAEATRVLQESGPASTGLTFIWIPQLFLKVPGGRVFLVLFFLGLFFAALSSLLSMIEMVARNFMDAGVSRHRAIALVGAGGFVMGIPSALWLGFLGNQDWVWGLGLMVSGLLFAVAAIRYGPERFRSRHINTEGSDLVLGRWWDVVIRWVVPLEFLALMVWWSYKAIFVFDREGWWDPFHPYSLATCLFQWGLVAIAFLLINRQLARWTAGEEPSS
jgi:NSS family neurotransmitter:Na+ symporter